MLLEIQGNQQVQVSRQSQLGQGIQLLLLLQQGQGIQVLQMDRVDPSNLFQHNVNFVYKRK